MRVVTLMPLVALVVVSVFFAGCSNSESSQPYGPSTAQTPTQTLPQGTGQLVTMKDFQFNPTTLSIKKGTTVTWTNQDSANHDVVSDAKNGASTSGLFKSKELARGESFSFTFDSAGEYTYICGIHPSMKGKIIVQE